MPIAERRPSQHQVAQFTGKNGNYIQDFMGEPEYFDYTSEPGILIVRSLGDDVYLEAGGWVVEDEGEFLTYNDEAFQKEFRIL